MKSVLIPALVLGLAACSPEVPNSASQRGVGFGSPSDYSDDAVRRKAALEGRSLDVGPVISSERTGSVPAGSVDMAALEPATPTDVPAGGGGGGRVATNNPGISDEQSFEAVTERETIESDKERLERQRAAYVEVKPGALPTRPNDSGPNIVEYALSTSNRVGQKLYKRSPVNAEARYERACGQYSSDDLAQEAFLEMGGPENDRKGMDPDGDGFACKWDPAPFRTVRR